MPKMKIRIIYCILIVCVTAGVVIGRAIEIVFTHDENFVANDNPPAELSSILKAVKHEAPDIHGHRIPTKDEGEDHDETGDGHLSFRGRDLRQATHTDSDFDGFYDYDGYTNEEERQHPGYRGRDLLHLTQHGGRRAIANGINLDDDYEEEDMVPMDRLQANSEVRQRYMKDAERADAQSITWEEYSQSQTPVQYDTNNGMSRGQALIKGNEDYITYRGRYLLQADDYEVVDMTETKTSPKKSVSSIKYALLLPAVIIGMIALVACCYCCCCRGKGSCCCAGKKLEEDYMPGVRYENGKKVYYEVTAEEQAALQDLQRAW